MQRLTSFVFLFLQKEKYHTHLALIYLEEVLKMRRDPSCSLDNLNKQRYVWQWELCKVYTVAAIVEETNKQTSNECFLQWEMSSICIPIVPTVWNLASGR